MVQAGLAYIVLGRVASRGAEGLAYLSLMTTFQGNEFISEVSRLIEWFAFAFPPG